MSGISRWIVVTRPGCPAFCHGGWQLNSSSSCTAQIDWVNFIQIGSTQYVAGPQAPIVLQENDLGSVYAHVRYKVSGNVCDPNYRLKDGDAAFLDPGTPIYQV